LQRVAKDVDKQSLMGVKIGPKSLPEILLACQASLARRQASFVFACANPHSLVVARHDARFRQALDRADAVVADGVGCQVGALLSGATVGPRITGWDFFISLMHILDGREGRVFFFGSHPAVLEKLAARVHREFPRLSVEVHSPPFGAWSEAENDCMLEKIRAFAPDALWVGMTAPKQEKWVAANAPALKVPIIGSIGAVFDYYAGVTKRAPPWVCRLGLEWLYRLPREPQRLWRRTFVSAPLFLWLAARDRFSRARGA
jgi:N-acetylglucosaminyldiphosphoundecaprenol N-acetyl-beta-D-mannosaminyltransferase